MESQFSITVLWNLSWELVGAYDFEILIKKSDTGGPNLVIVRMEYLESTIFQKQFCSLAVL